MEALKVRPLVYKSIYAKKDRNGHLVPTKDFLPPRLRIQNFKFTVEQEDGTLPSWIL